MVPSDDPNMGPNQSIPILEKFSLMIDNQNRILMGEDQFNNNQVEIEESSAMPKLNYQYSNQVSLKKEIQSPSTNSNQINFYGDHEQNDQYQINNI